jgi:HEPN domain-containing protein
MPNSHAQEWLDKAAEDEQVIAAIRSAGKPWSLAAYHVQQAAEKYIKAALVEAGVAPPRTHDLPKLLGLYPGVAPSTVVQASASMLSAYAWLTRYPGAPPIAEHNVAKAETHLTEIKTWAMSVIP